MSVTEKYDVLVFGSGTAGKVMGWTMAAQGKRTVTVERRYVGGSCPNIACLPTKNVIRSSEVASLVARGREFGLETGPVTVNMAGVHARKKKMVDGIIDVHMERYRTSGGELIFGEGKFTGPRTLQI